MVGIFVAHDETLSGFSISMREPRIGPLGIGPILD
jgi:hypothetical protein